MENKPVEVLNEGLPTSQDKTDSVETKSNTDVTLSETIIYGMTKNKPKRKKAMRACIHCQKSHLTCGDERPCKRCVHRGLASQCTDGQRKKAKYLIEPPSSSTLEKNIAATSASVQNSQPIPALNNTPYLINPCPVDYGFFSETANLEYDVLNNMLSNTMMMDLGTYQGFPDFPLAETWSPIQQNQTSSATISTPLNVWKQPKTEPQHTESLQVSPLLGKKDMSWQRSPEQISSSYSKVTSAYCYTRAYHYLLKYIQERMSKENVLRICRAISLFRPSFIALFMNLTEEDLIFVEKCFQRTLLEFEKLIALSGTPTVVWRRSGEIVLVGKEFSILTNWSSEDLVGNSTYIYEIMDDISAVTYWEKYATHAFDNSELSVMTTCNIYDSAKRSVPCAFCFTIKRDIFDTPSMIVGNFLPQLQ